MNKQNRITVLLSITGLLAAGPVWSHDEPTEAAAPAMSAADQAMMEAWAKAAVPGSQHAWLMESAGTWKVESKMWIEPGTEPMVMHGSVEREAMLGGRVLREEYSGVTMGEPFHGVGHTGYDNVSGEYWSTWMDDMSTGLHVGRGTCAEDHSSCTYTLVGPDPMSGGTKQVRLSVTFQEGKEIYNFYESRDGEEVKTMQMVYTRIGTD